MKLSLMFFGSYSNQERVANHYDLFKQLVDFADGRFNSIWLPERHFNEFGGLFPSPAIFGAIVASRTKKIKIRTGSIVLPINDPLRVAEEWSVIDQLSQGRVDLGFALGWNSLDFSLSPENYGCREDVLGQKFEQFQTLWGGGSIPRVNGVGKKVNIEIFPKPINQNMDYWLTCIGNKERFIYAGEKGFNLLTALIFQSPEELKENIDLYQEHRKLAGYKGKGKVTLMLHTFVGESTQSVYDYVVPYLKEYIKSSFSLWRNRITEFDGLSETDKESLWSYATQKYCRECGLFGDVKEAIKRLERFESCGVDEIACLVDFGPDNQAVLTSAKYLETML